MGIIEHINIGHLVLKPGPASVLDIGPILLRKLTGATSTQRQRDRVSKAKMKASWDVHHKPSMNQKKIVQSCKPANRISHMKK